MKRTCAILVMVLTIAVLIHSASLAWVSDNGLSSLISISGAVHKNYFEYGEGTVDKPYGIATPGQLYYFAWLQYLGFFNVDKDGDDYLDTFYFELSDKYLENGVLNMKGYTLPPIGTVNNPFLGNFNGKGITISNLTVKNSYRALSAPPSGTSTDSFSGADIIGFFGVVGSLPGDTTYEYYSDTNEIKNLALSNLTIHTESEKNTLIGIVAGYVNGKVSGVGVIGSTITIKEGLLPLGPLDQDNNIKNLSDYSLIGYCTKEYKDDLYIMDVTLSTPGVSDIYNVVPDMTSDGEGHGWGGSVKMSDIFGWLNNINDTAQTNGNTNSKYYIARTDVYDLSGKPVTVDGFSEIGSKPSLSVNTTTDSTKKFGTFVFGHTMNPMQGIDVNFVGGAQKVTEYKYFQDDNTYVPVYHIKRGTNEYLTLNNGTLQYTTSKENATPWYIITEEDGDDVIFTVNANNNTVYYLNGSLIAQSALNVNHENLPSWDASGNNTYQSAAGVRISYRYNNTTYYLVSNNGYTDVAGGTDGNNATVWYINQTSGGWTVSTTDTNGNTYYLSHPSNNDPGLSDEMGSNTIWQYSNNNGTITLSYTTSSGWMSTTYYLRFNNSNNNRWTISSSNNNASYRQLTATEVAGPTLSVEQSGTQKNVYFTKNVYVDDSPMNRYYDENGEEQKTGVGITYFPLSSTVSGDSYDPSTNNTGYIIGAGWGVIDTLAGVEERIENDSNIRISEYSNSLYEDGREPYTITYQTYLSSLSSGTTVKFQQLPPLVKEDGNSLSENELKSAMATVDGYGLVKYASCYNDYYGSIDDGECYGLHFMKASVSDQNTTLIDAYLNGEWNSDYEVPHNCIDFNLYERGFINFVAGSYYNQSGSVNDSFFSIYQIVRDGNDIKEIKEIYKIYGVVKTSQTDANVKYIDTSVEYVYTYVAYDNSGNKYEVDANGNPVTNGIDGKTMIFDCDWITNPTKYSPEGKNNWGNNNSDFLDQAFYFEVPVNEGEYAIGSTKGKTGAYLIYLDLAANAQIIERQKDYEKIEEIKYEGSMPNGVEILAPSETLANGVDPSNSAFVSINQPGEITFSTTDGATIIHTATSGTSAEYIGHGITLKDGGGNVMQMQSVKAVIERTTYRDHNLNTGEYTVTVITKTTIGSTVTYERSITKGKWDSETNSPYDMGEPEITGPQAGELGPKTEDSEENEGGGAVGEKPLINLYYSYGQDVTLTVKYEYVYDEKNPTYNIIVTNRGNDAVNVKAVLTESGVSSNITFVISDGTTENVLTNTTEAQFITINTSATGGESGGEGGEGGQTP